jgi:plastocyanin
MIPAGKTARIVLKRAGRIAFFCRLHPQMTGAITVLP